MTTSSLERVQRLPRDLALIALAIQAGVAVAGIGAQLIWSPYAEDMRRLYTTARALVPMLSSAVMNWAFAALLAWCFARHALDRHGPAELARPAGARGIFGVVFLLLVLVQGYVLAPLIHQVALSYIQNTAGSIAAAGFVFALSSVLQLVLVALIAWFACWLALQRRSGGSGGDVATSAPAASFPSSPRAVIAWVVGVFFVCLQMLMSSLFQGWIGMQQAPGAGPLVLGWIVAPLVVLALTFWGAWMGAREAAQPRPLRAIASSALAFVLLQLVCIAIAIAWMLWVLRPGHVNDIVGPAVGLAVIYVVLMVMLTRSTVGWLYRASRLRPQ
ncbi:hypothetical protein M2282_002590 [Variovorax boronicumulans]|uniref:hypothetical protein n=1 Tax=Variovorax boronicumulans TaxID=436515 RepID=UPI0024769B94|nr:hypothetical protein [Variovorax boronicumulans]MDH6167441.1 hypothetical protein [Variovorax boronicumulans]